MGEACICLGQLILGMLSGAFSLWSVMNLWGCASLLRKAEKAEEEERTECVNCDTLKPKKCVFHTQGIIGEERKSQLIHTWAWLSMSLIQNMFNITALHYVKTSIISHYLLCSDHYAEIMVTSARPLKYSTLFHIRRHSFLRDFTFPFTATEAVNSTKGLSSLD